MYSFIKIYAMVQEVTLMTPTLYSDTKINEITLQVNTYIIHINCYIDKEWHILTF